MIILPPQAIGAGYRQLQFDEPILSTDEFFSIVHDVAKVYPWRVSTFWTSDGRTHDGRVPYRRAVSLRARVGNPWRMVLKVYRLKIRPLFNRPQS